MTEDVYAGQKKFRNSSFMIEKYYFHYIIIIIFIIEFTRFINKRVFSPFYKNGLKEILVLLK